MSKYPIQPVEDDGTGVLRFKANEIVRHLLDFGREHGCGLNELAGMPFTDEDRQQLAQLIGYSLSGYRDLSYVSDDAYAAVEAWIENSATE
jgi:hypothetical protein